MFDRHEQLAELTDEQRARLRAVILSNDNDPLPVMGPGADRAATRLAGRQPAGRGVPDSMRWQPLITFVQTAMDAANAMVSVRGEFGSFGQDYRADMVRFVRDAYGLARASDAQLDRIDSICDHWSSNGPNGPRPSTRTPSLNRPRTGPLRTPTHPRGPVAPRPTTRPAAINPLPSEDGSLTVYV